MSKLFIPELVLEQLIDELQTGYAQSERTDAQWRAGQACVAFFKTDSLWYRARVTRIVDSNVQVGLCSEHRG